MNYSHFTLPTTTRAEWSTGMFNHFQSMLQMDNVSTKPSSTVDALSGSLQSPATQDFFHYSPDTLGGFPGEKTLGPMPVGLSSHYDKHLEDTLRLQEIQYRHKLRMATQVYEEYVKTLSGGLEATNALISQQKAEKQESQHTTFNEALSRNLLVLLPRQGNESRNLPFLVGSPYVRGPSENSGTVEDAKQISIYLAASAFDPYVFTGKLMMDGQYSDKMFVVKTANTNLGTLKLQTEYQVYLSLSTSGISGIPKVIGFFETKSEKGLPYAALVMEYAGRPLRASESKWSRQHRRQFESTLRAIHDAGFVHGNINSKSLLVFKPTGEVSIIGFSKARKSRKSECKTEMKRLMNVLMNKSHKPTRSRFRKVRLGPLLETEKNPLEAFNSLTQWMSCSQTSGVADVTCERLPDWIDVNFNNSQGQANFYAKWNSNQRPEQHRNILCFNEMDASDVEGTGFSQQSLEYSQQSQGYSQRSDAQVEGSQESNATTT